MIVILTMPQAAGAAPFPWHMPWVLYWMPPPAKDEEVPNAVRRKNFISLIVYSKDLTAEGGTPVDWNARLAIAWHILSKQLDASTDAIAAGRRSCREMS